MGVKQYVTVGSTLSSKLVSIGASEDLIFMSLLFAV